MQLQGPARGREAGAGLPGQHLPQEGADLPSLQGGVAQDSRSDAPEDISGGAAGQTHTEVDWRKRVKCAGKQKQDFIGLPDLVVDCQEEHNCEPAGEREDSGADCQVSREKNTGRVCADPQTHTVASKSVLI